VNRRRVLCGLQAAAAIAATRARAAPQPLPPDEAFQIRPLAKERDWLALEFRSEPGYFLYAHRFEFAADRSEVRIAEVLLPTGGRRKFDLALGCEVTYFPGAVVVRVRIEGLGSAFRLIARAQGCSDFGLCYPVIERTFAVSGGRP